MVEYPGEATLAHRLRSALTEEEGKPLAFVIGSGATIGSVPGTDEMLDIFSKVVGADPDDASDFRQCIAAAPPTARYQTATRFIIDRKGLPVLNRAVRIAVLRARSPKPPTESVPRLLTDEHALEELERDTQGWALTQGVSAMARVLKLVHPQRRGPILTTNFDPLIEVSLAAAGLDPWIISADVDGAINLGEVPSSGNLVRVIHLHGSWRHGDTLHTSAQLNSVRPKLLGGLREILTNTTCLVLGYGGWDDVLTRGLRMIIDEGAARDIEILWACHSENAEMGVLTNDQLDGRLHPYTSVNSNTLMPVVESQLRSRMNLPKESTLSVKTPRDTVRVPRGLMLMSRAFNISSKAQETSNAGLLAFYDGRTPRWSDVVGGRIPELDWVGAARKSIQQAISQFVLIDGPAGEGKTTGLMQIASGMADANENIVLWTDVAVADLASAAEITPTSKRIFIFVDDADLAASQIRALINRLREGHRSDVTIVGASRDTDWRIATRRIVLPSDSIVSFPVAGMTRDDSRHLVDAWSHCGPEGLGRLRSEPEHAKRAERLFEAANGSGTTSLLGAMLVTRYGTGFRQHVRDLLDRLARVPLPNGFTLLDAYLLVCGVTTAGMPPLRVEYLAWFLKLELSATESLVVLRLGREAAARRHGDILIARHPLIAKTALEIADEMGIDVFSKVATMITEVVSQLRGEQWHQHDLDVIYSAQNMPNKETAIVAAKAATAGDPSQLRLRCSEIGVLRRFSLFEDAAKLGRETWSQWQDMSDIRIGERAFLQTWARSEGLNGNNRAAAALNACSLLDLPHLVSLNEEAATVGLSGIASSLMSMRNEDDVKLRRWALVLADHVRLLNPEGGYGRQAEVLILRLEPNLGGEIGFTGTRSEVEEAIGAAVAMFAIGPSVRYRSVSKNIGGLLRLIELH